MLYPFQQDAVDRLDAALQQHRRVCLVAPTGTGKTVMATEHMRRVVMHGGRCLFLVLREEQITQTVAKLTQFGLEHGLIKAGYQESRHHPVQVASVQTLIRRQLPPATHVYADEAHRQDHIKILDQYPDAKHVLLTATPEYYGGRTLHAICDRLVVAITYPEAVHQKYIVKPRIFVPHKPDLSHVRIMAGDYQEDDLEKVMAQSQVTGDIVAHWLKYARERKTLVFACTIAHAEQLRAAFDELLVTTAIITGKTPMEERKMLLARLRSGTIRVLVNVAVFIEGWDEPSISCVVMARPTRSMSLFLQQAGRGCRTAAGKADYVLLDHAGNTLLCGSPAAHREWTLDPDPPRRSRKSGVVIHECKHCHFVFPDTWRGGPCPECGEIPTTTSRLHAVNGVLVEVEDVAPVVKAAPVYAPDVRERRRLWAIARAQKVGNPVGWVARRMNEWYDQQSQKSQPLF